MSVHREAMLTQEGQLTKRFFGLLPEPYAVIGEAGAATLIAGGKGCSFFLLFAGGALDHDEQRLLSEIMRVRLERLMVELLPHHVLRGPGVLISSTNLGITHPLRPEYRLTAATYTPEPGQPPL